MKIVIAAIVSLIALAGCGGPECERGHYNYVWMNQMSCSTLNGQFQCTPHMVMVPVWNCDEYAEDGNE